MIPIAKKMGDNIRMVCENDECTVFQMKDAGGEGVMTFYQVFPGVYLLYNDSSSTTSIFTLNRGISRSTPARTTRGISVSRFPITMESP